MGYRQLWVELGARSGFTNLEQNLHMRAYGIMVAVAGLLLLVVAGIRPFGSSSPSTATSTGISAPSPMIEIEDPFSDILREISLASDTLRPALGEVMGRQASDDAEPHAVQAADPDWDRFPRSTFSLGSYLSSMPDDIDGSIFFRHVMLNPADSYIPPAEREMLSVPLRTLGSHFSSFTHMQIQASFRDLHQAGEPSPDWPEVKMSRRSDAKDASPQVRAAADKIGVVKVVNGRAYAVPAPNLDATLRSKCLAVTEAGSGIISWFRARGICPAAQANVLAEELAATAFDRMRNSQTAR